MLHIYYLVYSIIFFLKMAKTMFPSESFNYRLIHVYLIFIILIIEKRILYLFSVDLLVLR